MMMRLAFAVPGLILTLAIGWAFATADFFASLATVVANPWGVVTLVDLYVGFVFTGLIIAAIERWKPWAWALLPLSFVLGNVVFAAWGIMRGGAELLRLARR